MGPVVVFDFDGTVAVTLPLCYYAFQQVFRTFDQREVSAEDVAGMFGPPEAGILHQHLVNQARIEDAVAWYDRSYEASHETHVQPFEPVHQLLQDLNREGYRLAVCTGKGRRGLEISLRQLGLQGLFEMEITGDDVAMPKPHPEGLLAIIERMAGDVNTMLMVEDSDADIEAAKRVGIRSVRVDWFSSVPHAFQTTPDCVCATVDALRTVLAHAFAGTL